jgi:DNA-directed RNA polymerase subunit RPC12/RpoP
MIVTCGDCGARFHLDPALLKDSSAARIRCRKCGGLIVVRLHEESPVPVLPPQETIPPSTVEPSAPAQEPVSPWPVEDPGPDRISPPPEEHPAGGNPAEETAETEPGRKVPSRRAPFTLKVLVISVMWILLLAGGTYYFGTTKSGHDMLGTLFAGWGSGRTGSVAETRYDIRDVTWHVDNGSAGGSLFVLRGAVANVGNVPSAGIRIQATLLGKDNQALAEKTAFAGNLLDNASLGRMDRPAVEGAMSNRFGAGNENREILPGKALPFMVLFFDPPLEIDAVMVKAIDAR